MGNFGLGLAMALVNGVGVVALYAVFTMLTAHAKLLGRMTVSQLAGSDWMR